MAPNPIDFRKVFSKFPDLGETKNFVVMTTVCSMLFIYFIGLVFTRRADKRDQLKVSESRYLLCSVSLACLSGLACETVLHDYLLAQSIEKLFIDNKSQICF